MRRSLVPLVVLLTTGVLVACDGDKAPSFGAVDSAAQPPASEVEPTPIAGPWFLPPAPRAAVSPKPPTTDTRLLGRADRDLARGLRAALEAAGDDLTGTDLYVFPITGSGNNLLVIELDGASGALTGALTGGAENPPLLFSADFLRQQVIEAAKVSRVALVLRASDGSSGSGIVITATLPADTLAEYLAGTITEEQATTQTAYEVRQVGP